MVMSSADLRLEKDCAGEVQEQLSSDTTLHMDKPETLRK
jgi:hypothetical protein